MVLYRTPFLFLLLALNLPCSVRAAAEEKGTGHSLAAEILQKTGLRGGLCVQAGCGDGVLSVALQRKGNLLVHILTPEQAKVPKIRQVLQSKGVYGRVSIEYGPLAVLPYADNLVNLVVVDDLPRMLKQNLSLKEIMRVLCPNGVAWLGQAAGGGTAGRETLTEKGLRDALAAGGIKDFEIVKYAGLWAKIQKPRLAGLDDWTHWRHGPDGNMVSKDTAVGIPTRLKWVVNPTWERAHVYSPINKLGGSRAMVSAKGRLFYVYDAAPRGMAGPMRLLLTARDAFNGLLLWKRPVKSVFPRLQPRKSKWTRYKYYWYRRRSLAAVGERVYTLLQQGGPLLALDAGNGKIVKTYDQAGSPEEVVYYKGNLVLVQARDGDRGYGYGPLCCLDAATGKLRWKQNKVVGRYLIVADDKVFCQTTGGIVCLDLAAGKEKWRKAKPKGAKALCFYREGKLFLKGAGENLYALSAKDGRLLWSYLYKDFNGQYYSDTDVYFVGGLVWVQVRAERWAMVGLDPENGAEKKRVNFPEAYAKTRGHHRCHPNKATERYFLLDTAGIDFVDRQAKKVYDVRTYRANCYFGLLPANGLLYLPPNVCQCGHYFRGFVSLAPASKRQAEKNKTETGKRFERGPAYGTAPKKISAANPDAWPSYRHDPRRSGSTTSEVPPDLKRLWERKALGNITAPTVAEGMVFIASKDTHQVRALDARSGQERWSYTAGGRIDSPPTIYAGLALFGCRNGWVYCLRAKDGALVWRFRAAPRERRIIAFGQLESSWPVPGSVLVQNGTVFFAAGRFSELDGGIFVYAADPASGKIIWKQKTNNYLSEILKGKVEKGYPPVCINDIPIANGNFISIRNMGFNAKSGAIARSKYSFWPRSGMLDGGSWTGRMRWRKSGLAAELMVFNSKKTCAIRTSASNKSAISPGKSEYKLIGKGGQEWAHQVPLRVRAMVLAGKTLLAAGIPDVVGAKDYWAAFDGKKGGELWAVSAADGKKLASLKLESAPVFDGMAAVQKKLYLATQDGRLLCFGKK